MDRSSVKRGDTTDKTQRVAVSNYLSLVFLPIARILVKSKPAIYSESILRKPVEPSRSVHHPLSFFREDAHPNLRERKKRTKNALFTAVGVAKFPFSR